MIFHKMVYEHRFFQKPQYVISRTRACVLIANAWEEMKTKKYQERIKKSFAVTGYITKDDYKLPSITSK